MRADEVVLVEPRGFCAGVEMAITTLALAVLRWGPPVYCVHPIVHNRRVQERFEMLGVRFVTDHTEVPDGAVVVLSAHGTSPGARAVVEKRAVAVVDAVCPLVSKVHHEVARRAAEGYRVLYVGHAGHDEAVGTLGVAPDDVTLVESADDLPDGGDVDAPLALLAQTTLPVEHWEGVLAALRARVDRPVWTARRSDICYATSNRQRALRRVAPGCDAVLVVGSASSSNTTALAEVAEQAGAGTVLRIDDASELPRSGRWGRVAVTAGASAPECAVTEVVDALRPATVVMARTGVESTRFPLPHSLRRHLADHPVLGPLASRDQWLSSEDVLHVAEAARFPAA